MAWTGDTPPWCSANENRTLPTLYGRETPRPEGSVGLRLGPRVSVRGRSPKARPTRDPDTVRRGSMAVCAESETTTVSSDMSLQLKTPPEGTFDVVEGARP